LHTLQSRKNEISGENIIGAFTKQLLKNGHLSVLNLSNNDLNDECAKQLLIYCMENIWIEEIRVVDNP